MDIVQQIRHLINQRDAAAQQAEDLTRQIDEIQRALGMPSAPVVRRPGRLRSVPNATGRQYSLGGLSQQHILDALAEKEPQSAHDLKARFPSMTTLPIHLLALTRAGQIVRHTREDGPKLFWYARSEAAFTDAVYVGTASAEVIAPKEDFHERPATRVERERTGLDAGEFAVCASASGDSRQREEIS